MRSGFESLAAYVKHGISLATIHGPGRDDRRYVLEVWTQPWLRWLIGKSYHQYDMHIYKVPGFRILERWLHSRYKGDDIYIPLSCRQDIRCYHLSIRGREVAAVVQLTEKEYRSVKAAVYHGTCDPE